jgi:glucosylceramidase
MKALILFLFALSFAQIYDARVFRSRADDELFADLGTVHFGGGNPGNPNIAVNYHDQYQEIIGFGGAFTETSAYNWDFLDAGKKREVINLLFDPKDGLDFSICRTHINSADFSLAEYTYVTDDDPELRTFDLGQDRKYVLPYIKAAKEFCFFFFFHLLFYPLDCKEIIYICLRHPGHLRLS